MALFPESILLISPTFISVKFSVCGSTIQTEPEACDSKLFSPRHSLPPIDNGWKDQGTSTLRCRACHAWWVMASVSTGCEGGRVVTTHHMLVSVALCSGPHAPPSTTLILSLEEWAGFPFWNSLLVAVPQGGKPTGHVGVLLKSFQMMCIEVWLSARKYQNRDVNLGSQEPILLCLCCPQVPLPTAFYSWLRFMNQEFYMLHLTKDFFFLDHDYFHMRSLTRL